MIFKKKVKNIFTNTCLVRKLTISLKYRKRETHTNNKVMTKQEIKKIAKENYLRGKYEVGQTKVFFDTSAWEWRAVNQFGFGIDSDMDIAKLLTRLVKELSTEK